MYWKTMEEKSETNSLKNHHHPFQEAGFLSKLFYVWMLPLFRLGLKKDLTEEDLLPPLKSHSAHELGDRLEASWNYELKTQSHPSLWRALWKVFRRDFMFTGCLWIILETFIKSSQPLCISRFLEYYRPDSTVGQTEAYVYGGLIVLVLFLQVIVGHYYLLNILQMGLKSRVATSSLVYRKALRLSRASLGETTTGQMVNLLSNDISRFDSVVAQLHCLWYCPIQASIVMILCYLYLGPTAMAGIGLLVLFIPFQMWMAKKTSEFRHKAAARTDDRIRLMNEIISGIQVIKMYTWEKPFVKLVEFSRRREIKQIRNISYIKAIIGSLNLFLNRCAKYLCLLAFVLTGDVLTAQYVYTLTTFYSLLQYAIVIYFPQGITQFAEVNISIKRLQKFLMHKEILKDNELASATSPKGVIIKNASVKWLNSQQDNTLEDINFHLNLNQLVVIVGPVGSGKTTVLHVILKEIPLTKGTLQVNGTISYASQEPWVFVGSIRQNILFGQNWDPKKYQEVVRVCALEKDFSMFPYGDKTIVGERGVTLSGGQKARITLARAIYKDSDIYLLDDPLSAVDTHVGRHIFEECLCKYLKDKAVVLVTHQLQYLHNVETIFLAEQRKVQAQGSYEELQKTDKEFTKLLKNNQEEFQKGELKKEHYNNNDKRSLQEGKPKMEQEKRGIGDVSWNVYANYFFAGGHWLKILLLVVGFILSQTTSSLTDYFQAFWVNLEQERQTNTTDFHNNDTSFTNQNCLYILTILLMLTVVLTLSRSFAFYRFTIKASLILHNNMFIRIIYATMKFFHSNPSGRILNRFSSDMGAIDEQLPLILLETVQIAGIVLATCIVIGTLNPWMYGPTVIMFVIFYLLRIVYLKTSRDVKRMEGTTRSPIYSHLNASMQGLTTIRAFQAEDILQREFDRFQDLNGSVWFTFVGCARSFGMWLDLHCVVYVALVIVSFLFFQAEMFGGSVGLAITQSLTFTGMFQWGMRQWSELENRMTAVERVNEYSEVAEEPDQSIKEPSPSWPERGEIQFESVRLKYNIDASYVLNGLSFNIKSTEKVGIVGRTGAGKSSLIAALFRLAEIGGKITIDGLDTTSIPLNRLRSSISIIPQEPVLFSGSLRKNLDPFDTFNDQTIWNALEEVELKAAVSDLPEGLETRMSEGGSNFSVGQRQLVCLARAIMRDNKIVILDEATANVDPQTDAFIQETICKKFFDRTVLTIAHRLNTIMDSDKVLVMEGGRMVEFGNPLELFKKRGVFYGMLKQMGSGAMESLVEMAKRDR